MFVKKKSGRSRAASARGAEPPPSGRRVPAQERSRQRVERIMDAAAVVFAEQGYDAATMEAIAARAETSIGSIYQFFPNKLSIFNELARRYRDKLRALFDALVSSPLVERSWEEILEAGIDALAAFHASEPGFRAVWVGMHLTEQVLSEGEALNRDFARRIEAILAAKLPALPAARRPTVATMVVEVFTVMLILSARRPLEGQRLMDETKELLTRYLAPYHPPGRPRARAHEERGKAGGREVRSKR